MASKKRDERVRNWVFILYPDSAPENWKDILQEMEIPCAISPLDDKDIDNNGEPKKSHHHVLFCLKGIITYDRLVQILQIRPVFPCCFTIPKMIYSHTYYNRLLEFCTIPFLPIKICTSKRV